MAALMHEKVWVDKKLYDDAERQYFETLAKLHYSGSFKQNNQPLPIVPSQQQPSPVTNTSKKTKHKNMIVTQSNTHSIITSPKKSRKNKKDKVKSNAVKIVNTIEKETSPEKDVEQRNHDVSYNSDKKEVTLKLCNDSHVITKETKNKDNLEKKSKADKTDDVPLAKKDTKDFITPDFITPQAGVTQPISGQCSLASEVAKARQHIKNSLECMDSVAALAGVPNVEISNKINNLEKENSSLKKDVEDLRKLITGIQKRVEALESKPGVAPAPAAKAAAPKEDSDDGVDLFGSDDEDETAEASKLREERLAAYAAKKSKKPVLIAKSNIILDVKPWDDETDMVAMEAAVRALAADGLLWGAAKLVPLAYGIHKLQISCVVEDDKISIDWLQEELEKLEDYVQSVDIAAFNKV